MAKKPTYEELEQRVRDLEQEVVACRQMEKSFREAENIRQLLNFAPFGVFLIDLSGKIIAANRKGAERFGKTVDEIIGIHLNEYVTPDVAEKRMLQGWKVIESLEPVSFEDQVEGRWYLNTIFPIFDDQGNITHLGVYGADVTERKQAEEGLRKSEERFRSLFEHAPDAYYILDNKGMFIDGNRMSETISGYEKKDLIGKTFFEADILSSDQIPKAMNVLSKSIKGLAAGPEELFLTQKNGNTVYIEIKTYPINIGNQMMILGIARDITGRKRAEEALKKSEEKFRVLVEESPLGVSLIGKDGRYAYLNPKFTELFGYSIRDIPTGSVWFAKAYPDPEYRKKVISLWIDDLERSQTGESRPHEFKVICKDNTEKVVQFRPVALEDGDQLVIYEDVTGKKRLEAQLLQSQKMEAIGTLAGGIAHDFNNALQGILGYAQILLLNMPKDAPEVGKLRKIEGAALRASELTQQLLTFSRKVEIKLRPADLNREVRQAEDLLRRTIPRMIDIELHLETDLNIINADAAQIEMVMMNLGINARDAMPGGGKLTIGTENVVLDEEYCRTHLGSVPGDYVKLSISDNGTGMDKQILEHIFEPFYTTKDIGKGTGLGLAMVYGIVKSHGGYITCSSEPGEGTIFRIYFPVVEEDRERRSEHQEKAEIRGGTETILLVDDEESVRELAEEILRMFGYAVLAAENGEKALEIYRENKEDISLVILDLIMPGMGGQKCLEEILKTDPSQKVVIASGYSTNGPTKKLLKTGAKGYIKKPFEMGPMLSVVREALDRK